MKVKEDSEKDGLKFNIQKTKIMDAVSSVHCKEMGNNGNNDRLYFLASKITADGDCSQEIKTLVPWKKSYDQPRQHFKKQRLLLTKGCLVKAIVFPVVMYGC